MKKNLLKSALLALMVLVGGNAWAQNTYFSQDYEADGATADWTTSTGGRFTPVILEEEGNHYLSVDQATRNNNGCTLSSTSLQNKVAAGTDFTMTFDVKIGSSTNQTPVEFNIYDAANSAKILGLTADGTYATKYIINGNSDQKVAISAGGNKGLGDLTWMSVKLSRSSSLTYLTITNKATSATVFERQIISTLSENGGLGKMEFITKRYNANFAIDNVVVREIQDGDVPAAIPTTYTIRFVDENANQIKDDDVISTVVGIEVTASSNHTAAIYANDKKYIYASGNSVITTVEEESSNVITLVFREAATWNYTVNATGAESAVLKTLASGSGFEGDAVTVPYPLYLNVDGTLWTKGATNKEYRASVTLDADNKVANFPYSATEIANVVYLTEGEEVEGTTKFAESAADIRSSNAAAGWTAEPVTLTTLPVGKYKASAVVIINSGAVTFNFALGNRTVMTISGSNNNWLGKDSTFVVATEKALTFVGGNAKSGLDYIYIQSLGEPTPEELAAAEAADALADAKAALGTAINEAKAIDTTDKEGVDALNTAITDAETALAAEDATVETLGAAKTALENAVTAFEEANAADPNDYTSYIVNADLTGEGGWDATGTKGISGGIVKVGNAAAFDFKQTIANLPAGKYKVTAQAAYRYGADEAAEAAAIAAETDTKLVQLYATVGEKTVSAKVQNRYDGASETDYANGEGSTTVNEKFVPNSTNAVKAWFAAGKYVNEVIFNLPADGAVTIGINRTGTPESDYTVIGPWTLTRIGDAEVEPEPVVPTLANGDFEGEYTVFASPKDDRDIYQPAGWTVTYENGEVNDMTALNSNDKAWNNFSGRPQLGEAGGNNTYWVRFRWGNSETLTLSQEVTLAAGTYKLSADAFFNGANGAAATISAAGQSAAITGNGKWANHKVVFNVAEEGTVTIALNVTQTQAVENVAAFDNVTLEAYVPLDGAKDELQAAITDAKAIETEGKTGVDELNAAIADAEAALNAADATVESLNAAKDALTAAVAEFNDVNITVPALAGWTRVRTANIENVADNYYVLVDANSLNYVMANEADHYRPCYRTVADPVANPSFAWTLEGSDNTFALKSFSTGSYFVQADGWNTSMTGSTGSATFQFTLNDGVYSIKCVQSNALVGHWNDSGAAVANDGENIAANKQAKDAPGFYLFAMPKATYEAAILAVRAEETAGASKENGIDVTAWIQNADWSGDFGGWARSGSWGNMQWGQQTLEVWNASNVVMKQTLTAVPDGTYKLTADVISGNGDNKVAFVYGTGGATVKSDAVTAEASAGNYNTMSAEVAGNTLTADNIVVTGGMLTVGLDIAAGWIVADNFKLYYYGEDMSQYAQAYHDALTAAQAIDTTAPMNGEVLNALNNALTTYASIDETNKATLLAAATALNSATEAATASIAAYATAAEILPKMKELTESTNVYTAEALDAYYGQWAVKYNEKTLTTDEANALEDPFLVTGWRASVTVDNFLLSAWDTNPDFVDAPYYINTWSTEGNNDGSEFRVPFFEYWTGDDASLGEKVLTGTMSGLAAGEYDVTAWVRVRAKNGYEAPAYGITMQANDGEAVDVAAGDQIGESQFFLKEFTATGTVAEDGVLNIKFNVAGDNNISWLSFKNVKFEKKAVVPEFAENVLYSWESPEGTPIEYGGTISYENGDGDRLNYPNSGYYTICLNGKKINLDDEAASANAGHMVITLDNAVTEGDIIAITGYITKNTSSKSSAWIVYENGTTTESAVFGDESNIFVPEGGEAKGTINTKEVIVSAEATGSKTITLTRGQTGTNLFITKLEITKGSIATGISNIASDRLNGTIYNLNGQKMDKAVKGLYIINGKKVVVK